MKKIILLVLLSVTEIASAWNISQLQEQIDNRSSIDGVLSQTTNLMLRSYYRGISETLSAQPGPDGRIYILGKAIICMPQSANLSTELVQAMAESEIKNVNFYQTTYGKDWKLMPATVPVFLGLARVFPCT